MMDTAPYTTQTAYSWIDDYMQFATSPACCKQRYGYLCNETMTHCSNCFHPVTVGKGSSEIFVFSFFQLEIPLMS